MDRHHDPHHPEHDERLANRLAIPGDVRPTLWRTPPPQQPGCLSDEIARHLLDDHTRSGDIVVDVDDDTAFAATAAAIGRRHHALGGDNHLATLGHAAGYIDLILVHWPRPAVNPHWLLLACRALLSTGGHLVVAASVEPSHRVAQLSALGGAAGTAGLRAVRHVAAVAPQAATPDTPTCAGTDSATASPARRADPPPVSPHMDLLIFELGEDRDD
jgi:hypothetical protein